LDEGTANLGSVKLVVEIAVEVDAAGVIGMLQDGLANLEDSIAQALDQGGAQICDIARTIVPVRTGFLRSTIGYSADGLSLELTASAYYAGFVEFGTRRMKAEPYMRPAFYQFYPMLIDAIAAAAANAFQ